MPHPNQSAAEWIVHVDGASRHNPGPAAFGYVIHDRSGRVIDRRGEFLGETTNNVAEYRGMIAAARRAVELGARSVEFRVDSELLQRQVAGKYRVRAPHLRPLWCELLDWLGRIPWVHVVHVPREMNREADRLANQALDVRGVVP